MRKKEDYSLSETVALKNKYMERGEESTGSKLAMKWYLLGIRFGQMCDKADHENYVYYYDYRKHNKKLDKESYKYFNKAVECFVNAAEEGSDLATMFYAVYLFSFKQDYEAALPMFLKASEMGLALADYQLWLFYKNEYCGVKKDEAKAEFYYKQYHDRIEADERQFILAWDLEENRERVIGRAYMYNWFAGYVTPEQYDTPGVEPSSWKYAR